MYPRCTHETRNNSEHVIEESKLKPSFIMSPSTKSLVQFDYDKAASIYFGLTREFLRRTGHLQRCPVRLRNSQDVSLIQRVLIPLVLLLKMNDGSGFDTQSRVRVLPDFMGKSLVIAVRNLTERTNETRS